MKVEIYEVPRMQKANFSRLGGIMEVRHINEDEVQVVQSMPSPASPNLPWIVINDTKMPREMFDEFVRPLIEKQGEAKLVKTEER